MNPDRAWYASHEGPFAYGLDPADDAKVTVALCINCGVLHVLEGAE